jgi:hypothetical protein
MTVGGVGPSPESAARGSEPGQPTWRMITSQRFEIHYLPELAPHLDRARASAERAYRQISGRLNFVLPTRVPLVLFAPSGPLTWEQTVAYATSDTVAPPQPHRGRIVLPLRALDDELDALMVHELTHLLVCEIVVPRASGDGGLPRWVHEGLASYMVGAWTDEQDRLVRDLVVSGDFPALSQLTGTGGFANERLIDALGHVAFDYIESRWGPARLRRFLNALVVPRRPDVYEAAFDQTPAEFDAAFRQYTERRFRTVVR